MTPDSFDNKILTHLKKNGRMPHAAIGKDIGLTAPAVAKRIQKMENNGIIQGYQVNLNYAKLGATIHAMVAIKMGFGKLLEFQRKVENFKEIIHCYRITGDDCMMLEVRLDDNAHLIQFLDNLRQFGTTKTNIILDDLLLKDE